MLCARAKEAALDQAFCSAFALLKARTSKQHEAALAAERDRAEERAAACKTVWDASRYGVPVRTLRELMEIKDDKLRYAAAALYAQIGILQLQQSVSLLI